jgi:nicotinic acid mononucleotide adenylyltransferase/predicted short-subunit dehydrogenase-like oxidoreductase (DUF2520 family)
MKWFRGHTAPVVGVYGGAFDPPHLGHALLPGYVLARGEVDHVIVAPCADHPLGKDMRPFDARLQMTRATMEAYGPRVEVSAIEADLAQQHGGASVSLRLLEAVAAAHPAATVRLIVGSDITTSGETARWFRWDEIERRFPPLVVARAGFTDAGECALPDLHSRDVRAWLASSSVEDHARARSVIAAGAWPWVDPAAATTRPSVTLVGHGHVATHAEPWLRRAGHATCVVSGRQAAAGQVTIGGAPSVVWILVGDPQIEAVAAGLVGRIPAGAVVLHGAGARRAAEVLRPLAEAGHPVGTLHPICALRRERPWPSPLPWATFGVEGDPPAFDAAMTLVDRQPWLDLRGLPAQGRVAYHGACALVANHLAVLREYAARVLRDQGHDAAVVDVALDALLASSLDNLAALGIPRGITGPVARGDLAAVAAHCRALPEDTAALYEALSGRLEALVAAAARAQPNTGG